MTTAEIPENLEKMGSLSNAPVPINSVAVGLNSPTDCFDTLRLEEISRQMGCHPQYLDIFLRTQQFLMRGEGPLPYSYRHFIAIMAAGRHQCSALIRQQRYEFLQQGGEEAWLKGVAHVPQKLRDLYELNKVMAHRPWLLSKTHIERLTKGRDNWSLAEVVHAVAILAHFHSLSTYLMAVNTTTARLRPETNGSVEGADGDTGKQQSSTPPRGVGEAVDVLMQRMKTLSEQQEETTQEEMAKRFEKVEAQTVELGGLETGKPTPTADISLFIEDPDFGYQDFAKRGEDSAIPTFRVQDYSWEDHGYSLVNRLYNDIGNFLDDKFKTAYNLTYYTMGGRRDVDTSTFRRAIWNYIQCIYGIRHDDYDYGEVNQLLERPLKTFIKMVCCYPEHTSRKVSGHVMRELDHSEKIHVTLLCLEARLQSELLYALRAIMCYMT